MAKKATSTPSLFDEPPPSASPPVAPPAPALVPPPANFPPDWGEALKEEFGKPYFLKLKDFVTEERKTEEIFPPAAETFNAFRYTRLAEVRVVILGQDPYPTPGQGHGICFSVKPGIRLPGSLRNIYKELQDDLSIPPAKHGYLVHWATQGILMLNAVLTVRSGKPNSHAGKGWETFTDAALAAVNALPQPVVFLLWGAYAQKKAAQLNATKHTILKATHPSPLSASNGFFGSKPFSKINSALTTHGREPIDWKLPAVAEESPA
ncbi:MAG: uracil-DNA glycosylase [Fimbriiglobus sp.]